jgi:hypothetical protein
MCMKGVRQSRFNGTYMRSRLPKLVSPLSTLPDSSSERYRDWTRNLSVTLREDFPYDLSNWLETRMPRGGLPRTELPIEPA